VRFYSTNVLIPVTIWTSPVTKVPVLDQFRGSVDDNKFRTILIPILLHFSWFLFPRTRGQEHVTKSHIDLPVNWSYRILFCIFSWKQTRIMSSEVYSSPFTSNLLCRSLGWRVPKTDIYSLYHILVFHSPSMSANTAAKQQTYDLWNEADIQQYEVSYQYTPHKHRYRYQSPRLNIESCSIMFHSFYSIEYSWLLRSKCCLFP